MINLEITKLETETDQIVKMKAAEENQTLKVFGARAQRDVAEADTKKKITFLKGEADSYSAMTKVLAENQAKIVRISADARLESAKNSSQAQLTVARAEGQAQAYLEGQRKHAEAMEKVGVLEQMARNVRMVISGKNGQDLIGYFRKALD